MLILGNEPMTSSNRRMIDEMVLGPMGWPVRRYDAFGNM